MKLRHMKGIHPSKKVMIIALAVVVAMGAGVAWYVWQQSNQSTKNTDNGTSAADESTYGYPKESDSAAEAAKIASEYSSGAASAEATQARLEAAKKAAAGSAEKEAYALAAIGVYSEGGEYDRALALALEAESTYTSATTAATVASMYDALSQYANAAKYFQLAADRSEKTTDPTQRTPYNDYMNSKREAEAKL